MRRNSSTFSFSHIPLSAILAIVIVIAAEFAVGTMVDRGALEKPKDAVVFSDTVNRVMDDFQEDVIVILGNSRSGGIVPKLLSTHFFNVNENRAVSLSAGGAMPLTQRFMLDELGAERITKDSLVILNLTPMCFNRYNYCLQRTLMNYYRFPEFIKDLVCHFRLNDVCYFLNHCSMNMMRCRKQLSAKIKTKLFKTNTSARIDWELKATEGDIITTELDRSKIDPLRCDRQLGLFKDQYYIDYTIDPLQIDSVQRVLDSCMERGNKVVLVLLPLSKGLRDLLGTENLQLFVNEANEIAQKNDVPLLDYLSSYTGNEYVYYDISHLATKSKFDFCQKLGEDLAALAEQLDFPIKRYIGQHKFKSLKTASDNLSASKGGEVVLELNMGEEKAGRNYFVLGSISGSFPGMRLPNRASVLPLNKDLFTTLILTRPNAPIFENFSGVLDSKGMARAKLRVPKSISKNMEGRSIWFCFMLKSPRDFVSNPVRVDFVK